MPPAAVGRRPRALVVLLVLAAGLALGALAGVRSPEAVRRLVGGVEVLGTLWINAIRMTVIPLVAALTLSSVASTADARSLGRIGAYAVPLFVVLLAGGGVFTMLIAPTVLDRLVIAPDVAAALRASAAGGALSAVAPVMPSVAQRIVDIVPVNPLRAAADGAILPVVVFALVFGVALTRLDAGRRGPVVELARATADTLLVLVEWVLLAAPVGVFALALGVGSRMGAGAAGALLWYVATISAALFAWTLALYPVAVLLGRVSPRALVAAALPAQAVAFSSRSSLAALPAMIAGARDTLRLGPAATGFTLPLAVSIFRVNVPIAWVVGFLFLGKLYGVPVGTGALVTLVLTSTLISFSVPGIPSASLFLMSPVLVEYGLPAEGVGLLIAIDAIPDMFKTLVNATAHMTAAVVLERADGQAGGPAT